MPSTGKVHDAVDRVLTVHGMAFFMRRVDEVDRVPCSDIVALGTITYPVHCNGELDTSQVHNDESLRT